jgi:hypothetical protein
MTVCIARYPDGSASDKPPAAPSTARGLYKALKERGIKEACRKAGCLVATECFIAGSR